MPKYISAILGSVTTRSSQHRLHARRALSRFSIKSAAAISDRGEESSGSPATSSCLMPRYPKEALRNSRLIPVSLVMTSNSTSRGGYLNSIATMRQCPPFRLSSFNSRDHKPRVCQDHSSFTDLSSSCSKTHGIQDNQLPPHAAPRPSVHGRLLAG